MQSGKLGADQVRDDIESFILFRLARKLLQYTSIPSTRPIFFGVHPVKAVTSEGLRLVVEVHAISNAINLGVIVVSQRYRKGTKEEI